MTTTLYQQDERPWHGGDPRRVDAPAASTTVWVVEITPMRTDDEPMRSERVCSQAAHHLATLGDIAAVAWSRREVHVVVELDARLGADEVVRRVQLSIPTRMRTEIAFWAVSRPDEWDWALRSIERAAREALGARHQCQPADGCLCLCDHRGNEYGVSEPHRRGERGYLLGRAGEL